MRTRKKLFYLPLISVASLVALIYIIFYFPPSFNLPILGFNLPIIISAFLLFFIFMWSLVGFIFANKIQGLIVALLPTVYLLLRYFKLNQVLFLILLIIIFAGLELLIFRKH
jgi:hypothetical protein